MIIAQPHADVNPVIIYEKCVLGIYKAKVSLTIISLLHDFMQTYPDIIQFYNIGKYIIFDSFLIVKMFLFRTNFITIIIIL